MSPFFLLAATPPLGAPSLSPALGLAIGLFLVFLNGFFVAAEFALVKVRPTQVEPHAARGERRGQILQHMVAHLDAYLSATQLGITLASLALGWVGEPAFAWIIEPLVNKLPGASPALVHSLSLSAAFGLITLLHIVLGELAPKSLAIRKAAPTALWIAPPLFLFYKVTYPAIWLLNHAANALLKMVGIAPLAEGEIAHSEEELRLLLASASSVEISQQKRKLLDNVFELSNRMARQVMVPRPDVVFLSTDRSLDENLELARASGHTRFPLCRGDLDQAVGLIHIKDLFHRPLPAEGLEAVARELTFVPETLSLDRLLRRMRGERIHLAAVLDEYGGVSGLVTLENVIETIVGPIQDEFDTEAPSLIRLAPGRFQVAGNTSLPEVEDALGVDLEAREEDTIAGVVLSELGRRPRVGDRVRVGALEIAVLRAELNRIYAVEIRVVGDEAPSDGTGAAS